MSDLTERLRRGFGGMVPPVCDEAANEIEALQSRLQDAQLAYDKASRSIVSKALLAERDALTQEVVLLRSKEAEYGWQERESLVRRLAAYQLRRQRARELVTERGSAITIPELLSHIFADYDSLPAGGRANTGPVAGRVITDRRTSDPSAGADGADRESPQQSRDVEIPLKNSDG